MAHFAQIDDNVVLKVIVVSNEVIIDANGKEQESLGINFCKGLFGGEWVQTSYNGNIRKNYAGIGYKYDADLDAFISPKPYASWTLNNDTAQWEAPVPYPTDGQIYEWDENTKTWVAIYMSST